MAATSGHDYVATPGTHCYINRPYEVISLEKAYSFEPLLTSLATVGPIYGNAIDIEALQGGQISLPMLASVAPLYQPSEPPLR